MWRDITCPEQSIGLKLVDFLTHFKKYTRWYITLSECTIRASFKLRVDRIAIFVPTAEHIITICIAANFIVQIEMNIRKLDKADRFSLFFLTCLFNTFV